MRFRMHTILKCIRATDSARNLSQISAFFAHFPPIRRLYHR